MIVLAMLASSTQAVQLEVTRAELCSISHRVVVAEVTSTETRWTDGPDGGIERIAWATVHQKVRGPAATDVIIRLPGGTIGNVTQWIEDVPKLRLDQPYLFFLAETPQGLEIIGGEQGALMVSMGKGDAGPALPIVLETLGSCGED